MTPSARSTAGGSESATPYDRVIDVHPGTTDGGAARAPTATTSAASGLRRGGCGPRARGVRWVAPRAAADRDPPGIRAARRRAIDPGDGAAPASDGHDQREHAARRGTVVGAGDVRRRPRRDHRPRSRRRGVAQLPRRRRARAARNRAPAQTGHEREGRPRHRVPRPCRRRHGHRPVHAAHPRPAGIRTVRDGRAPGVRRPLVRASRSALASERRRLGRLGGRDRRQRAPSRAAGVARDAGARARLLRRARPALQLGGKPPNDPPQDNSCSLSEIPLEYFVRALR